MPVSAKNTPILLINNKPYHITLLRDHFGEVLVVILSIIKCVFSRFHGLLGVR